MKKDREQLLQVEHPVHSPEQLLKLDQVSKSYSRLSPLAVNQVSLGLEAGQILTLLGPSGCGKTTLLRLIAGFEQAQAGEIYLRGRKIHHLPPEHRDLGMVFQDFALFPHLNVWHNVAFGMSGRDRALIKTRVEQVLSLVGLLEFQQRYPHQLSGGQQQRVALARAIAPDPALILLDEPLSNLDAQIRLQLRRELRQVLKATGKTAIFVTHDQEEAMHLADLVAVMRQGKIEQIGTPQEIYERPNSQFVAEFVSQANTLAARRQGQFWQTEIGDFAVNGDHNLGIKTNLVIRQEDLEMEPDRAGIALVSDRLFVGRDLVYYLQIPSGRELIARPTCMSSVNIGERVNLKPKDWLVFPA
ncbi:MAG: ABC transporter ATP-binding protein [Pseudanabaenaceae cyanobacterium bins.68]|nr:ABC transporter ATP-binding protein [Pseudanabaenaceae cyanobacterium bins.68]